MLDDPFAGKCGRVGRGGESPARSEPNKGIEQRLGLAAKQRFVVRPANSDVEALHAACAAFVDDIADQDEPGALARVLTRRVGIEHRRAAIAIDEGAEESEHFAGSFEGVDFDQRAAVGKLAMAGRAQKVRLAPARQRRCVILASPCDRA